MAAKSRDIYVCLFNSQLKELTDCIDKNASEEEISNCAEFLKTHLDKIEELTHALVESAKNAEQASSVFTVFKSVSLQYKSIMAKVKPVATGSEVTPTVAASPALQERRRDLNLPQIKIEAFGGEFTKWTTFHDVFQSLIHKNSSLSGAEKLQLLKNHLRGDAADVISYLSVTDECYEEAWQLLCKRYSNKRLIIQSTLHQLFQIPKAYNLDGLKKLLNSASGSVRALKSLKLPVDQWDAVFCYHIEQKLDQKTLSSWEEHQSDEPSKFADLLEFVESKVRQYEAGTTKISKETPVTQTSTCPACQQQHKPYACESFRQSSPQERFDLIKASRRCVNCLEPNHAAIACQLQGCKKCGKKHNTLLHLNNMGYASEHKKTSGPAPGTSTSPAPGTSASSTLSATTIESEESSQPILGSAMVYIIDNNGKPVKIRAILDQGSQSNIITTECAKRLKLTLQGSQVVVNGVGNSANQNTKGKVLLTIQNANESFSYDGVALVMDKVVCDHPRQPIDKNMKLIKGLDLADENFHQPGPVEALLGVDLYIKACRKGIRRPRGGEPGAINTAFGWVVMGSVNVRKPLGKEGSRKIQIQGTSVNFVTIDPSSMWTIDQVPKVTPRTKEDKMCEEFYNRTTTRQQDGRYMVQLPLISNPPDLGESRFQALKRFENLERKFEKNPSFAKDYKDVIGEYIDLGHLEEVPLDEQNLQGYYIPHHAVIKEASSSTKTRVVFDASAKSTNQKSLNDNLMTGPRIQDELFTLLVRFRNFRVAITADIEKMYRMIKLCNDDRRFQRILWRFTRDQPVQEYQLTIVSFGVKSSPYQATKTLHTLADDEHTHDPEARIVLKRDFYVDDLLTGAETEDEARDLQGSLQSLLKKGGFHLTKWASSHSSVLGSVPEDERLQDRKTVQDETGIKTLGLYWKPASDSFGFSYEVPEGSKVTKRIILSDIARIFDPLGWLAPVTISGKILFQQLWRMDLDWDTPVPQHIQEKWSDYCENLSAINDIKVERCIKGAEGNYYILYGFSDASELAYGACVYLCTVTNTKKEVHLVAAKTKVASLHATTLPRLELCAALQLAQLLESIEKALPIKIQEVHAFTDSMVTLQWITNENVRWKAFVANRVSAIRDSIPHGIWHHIPGKLNIADCLSRGIKPHDLKALDEWWHGPKILHQSLPPQFVNTTAIDEAKAEARMSSVLTTTTTEDESFVMRRFSSLNRLIRVTSYISRIISFALKKPTLTGPLSVEEIEKSRRRWIKEAQRITYPSMVTKGDIPNQLQNLQPFLDKDGVIRVGGRLRYAEVTSDQKYPILLAKESYISNLIARDAHHQTLHGGPQAMTAYIRQQYWIVGLKNLVKETYRKCFRCKRLQAKTCQQLMGDLPRARVVAAQPFLKTGCDFMGPFLMRTKNGRGSQRYKAYVALFVCFTTRAIHLECVIDLTTSAFLAALRRFISRRGKPSEIYSDLGTNFVGGNNELQAYIDLASQEERNKEITEALTTLGIQWNFNPGGAPHMGGLWEAGVKSTKYHLKRVIGDTSLTYEELHTVLCQVEAVLNSRPLMDMSDDPSDYQALTPGHFLIGRPLLAHPEPDYTTEKDCHLTRWSLLQKMVQHFWKRWHGEYITRLQQRPKWLKATKNLEIGELVLIKEDNTSPLHWKLGRIEEVFPGADGNVRVVTVKTATGSSMKRPITKICKLPEAGGESTETEDS